MRINLCHVTVRKAAGDRFPAVRVLREISDIGLRNGRDSRVGLAEEVSVNAGRELSVGWFC